MTRVICCRHGQSVANAGAATADPLTIPLTELGRRQAEEVAQQWNDEPGLIVVSPAERARATSAPTIRRFPNVACLEWPIHEFTYLNPSRCAGTTGEQRRAWVEAYWSKADPRFVDGDSAESFEAFIERVEQAIEQLSGLGLDEHRPILLFGHGQFTNAMRWRQMCSDARLDMLRYRAFDLQNPILNCELVELKLDK